MKPDPDLPLADDLKTHTWSLHAEAETTGVVAAIIQRRVILRDYLEFLQNLAEIYSALESEMTWLDEYPSLQKLLTPAVFRGPHIRQDYDNLRGLNPSVPAGRIHPAAQSYMAHITRARTDAPPAMLAHIYVRYLGDLNGGRVLQRLVRTSLGVPEDCLSFYAFPDIPDLRGFTAEFREALNEISLSNADRGVARKAALEAFKFNIALSRDCESQAKV